MTTASFAKLSIRTVVTWLLLVVMFPELRLASLAIRTSLSQSKPDFAGLLLIDSIFASIVVLLSLVWCYAEGLSRLLLPKGESLTQAGDYIAWQRITLTLIGGWLLCKALQDVLALFVGVSSFGIPLMAPYDFIVGFLLILGFPRWRQRHAD